MSVTIMPTFCKDCIYWEKVAEMGMGLFGICKEPTVPDKLRLDKESSIGDSGVVWTEEYFGCIHWRKSDGVIVKLGKLKR